MPYSVHDLGEVSLYMRPPSKLHVHMHYIYNLRSPATVAGLVALAKRGTGVKMNIDSMECEFRKSDDLPQEERDRLWKASAERRLWDQEQRAKELWHIAMTKSREAWGRELEKQAHEALIYNAANGSSVLNGTADSTENGWPTSESETNGTSTGVQTNPKTANFEKSKKMNQIEKRPWVRRQRYWRNGKALIPTKCSTSTPAKKQ